MSCGSITTRVVFPARDVSTDPRSEVVRRHHVDPAVVNKAIKVTECEMQEQPGEQVECERHKDKRRENDEKQQADCIAELPRSFCALIAHGVVSGLNGELADGKERARGNLFGTAA
jgi:hypothetical protein